MRDAFGGAFMIKLFLVFIFIYICFTALALNYARAFKVKNKIISYIEDNEMVNIVNLNASEQIQFDKFLETEIRKNMEYSVNIDNFCDAVKSHPEWNEEIEDCYEEGIVITKKEKAENTEGVYFQVDTYVGWNLSFLNIILNVGANNQEPHEVAGTWIISGETRIVVKE